MPDDPMTQFVQLVAHVRADRIRRELAAQKSSDPGSDPTEAAHAPNTPAKEIYDATKV